MDNNCCMYISLPREFFIYLCTSTLYCKTETIYLVLCFVFSFAGFSSLIGYSVSRIFHPFLYFVLQNRDNPSCHVSSAHRLRFLRISHLPLRENHIFKQTGERKKLNEIFHIMQETFIHFIVFFLQFNMSFHFRSSTTAVARNLNTFHLNQHKQVNKYTVPET
jgi:hypothetical protein